MAPQKKDPCFCNIASGNDARFTNHVQTCIEAKLLEYWLWLDKIRLVLRNLLQNKCAFLIRQ